MAYNIGARVIATVSTDEKAKLAHDAGADDVILYTQSDFEADTKRLTGGKGVDVVYDSWARRPSRRGSYLRPRGMMALFGGSSGAMLRSHHSRRKREHTYLNEATNTTTLPIASPDRHAPIRQHGLLADHQCADESGFGGT